MKNVSGTMSPPSPSKSKVGPRCLGSASPGQALFLNSSEARNTGAFPHLPPSDRAHAKRRRTTRLSGRKTAAQLNAVLRPETAR